MIDEFHNGGYAVQKVGVLEVAKFLLDVVEVEEEGFEAKANDVDNERTCE